MTTGWLPWDPIFAILIAGNILRSGLALMGRGISGLMDSADPKIHRQLIEILETETRKHGILFHRVRHRSLGDRHWVELHLLFPQDTRIQDAHRVATHIEKRIDEKLEPGAHITTHLEAIEDHGIVHPKAAHEIGHPSKDPSSPAKLISPDVSGK